MTKSYYTDACLERAEKAQLSNTDHIRCIIELEYACTKMVPELARRLQRACAQLRYYNDDITPDELEDMPREK